MRQLGQTVEVMKRVANSLGVEQVLDVVNAYSTALDLLDGYDHQTIAKPKAKGRSVALSYEECRTKRIADHTLVALTVMIAESKPQEKELMVNIVMTFLK